MTTFPIHDTRTAPEGSKTTLAALEKALGSIPNLFGVFAGSPALLKAYAYLAEIQEKESAFDETERQTLFLTVSSTNDCEYCVAAHTAIASMKGVPAAVPAAVRNETDLPSARLEALRRFGRAVVVGRGHVEPQALREFLTAGYTARHVLEVVLAVGFKTLSNYTNHLASTPLDAGFAKHAWKRVTAPA